MTRTLLFVALFGAVSTALRPAFPPIFDSISGTWKRTGMTLVEANGKTSDMMQRMIRVMPCTKDITYTFSNDGRLRSTVPDACGALKKNVEAMNAEAHWTMNGRKLTLTTTMKGFPTTIYDVRFSGNTMTWVFNYADNPKTPNPKKAQQLTTVYQRI